MDKKNLFILVVEDDYFQQRVIQTLLEKMGNTVEVANDGTAALTKAHHSYDLILMDIGLPDLDGLEVTQKIRKQGIMTPIVAITAHMANYSKQRCLEAGMTNVINKPMTQEKLLAIIESIK